MSGGYATQRGMGNSNFKRGSIGYRKGRNSMQYTWYDENGKVIRRCFSIAKYGVVVAHSMCLCLRNEIFPLKAIEAHQQNLKVIRYKHMRNYKNTRRRERYASDECYKLSCLLRARAAKEIKIDGGIKSESSFSLLGCSVDEVRTYLQDKFTEGMTWENHGEWEIDHILPVASFDLTNPDQQRVCFHFTNLQPLWWKDNREKGDR